MSGLFELIFKGCTKITTKNNNGKVAIESMVQIDGDILNSCSINNCEDDALENHFVNFKKLTSSINHLKYGVLLFISIIQMLFFWFYQSNKPNEYDQFFILIYFPLLNYLFSRFGVRGTLVTQILFSIPFIVLLEKDNPKIWFFILFLIFNISWRPIISLIFNALFRRKVLGQY